MDDTEMLDWLEKRGESFREAHLEDNRPYELCFIGGNGEQMIVFGANLRDCVRGAKAGDGVTKR